MRGGNECDDVEDASGSLSVMSLKCELIGYL